MKSTAEVELAERKAYGDKLQTVNEEMESKLQELTKTVEQFQQRYANEIGKKQNELNRLNALLSELRIKKATYGSDVKQISQCIDNSTETSKKKINNIYFKTKAVSHSIHDLKEAKRVYRKIASIIHPDKATEVGSRTLRTKLMAELNDAYALKDTKKMQGIFEQWHESPEAVVGEGIDAELERTLRSIARLTKRISDNETEMSKIMTSDIYVMMVKVQKAEKVGRNIFAEMSNSLDAKIKEVQNILVLRMYG